MDVERHIVAGSVWARWCVAFLLVLLQFVLPEATQATALALTPTPSVQQTITSQQSAASTDTNDLLWFTTPSNKWTLLGAMNFAVSGTSGTGTQTCATSIDTVQDGISWKGMAGYNGANGWTFTLPNTWKGQSIVMAPYYKNGGVLFAGWGCRDISGQLGSNATYPGRRTATNGSVYPFMWADTLGGIAQNGSFIWEHSFTNLDPGTTYKFQYLTLLAGAFCSLEDITTTGISNGVSYSTKNLAVTANLGRTKGSQVVTSTVSGVTQYNIVRKGSGVNCNHMGLSAIQVHASELVPQISSFSVSSGPRSGGTSTTINGNNLSGINSVTIGGNAAIIESTSESSVSIVTPAGTVGAADIVISNGTDTTTMAGGYTYTNQVAPSLQISLSDNPPAVVYGMTTTLAAQVSTAGFVTFKSGGVAIAGCSNVAAVAFVATCSWKGNAANSNTRLTADFVPTDSVTYTNLSGAGLMTVNVEKASAVIVASSPTVEYGDAVPLITSSVIGLVNGDSAAVVTGLSCFTNYTTLSAVGSSPITSCSGGSASNYLLTYSAGSVTVNSISQSVLTLQNNTFEFGNTLTLNASGGSGSGSYSYSLSSSGSAGCSRTGAILSASTVGTCTVTVTRDASGNYSSRSQNFTITVDPSDQNLLMVDDVRGYYGSPLALSVSGGSGNGAVTYAVTSPGTAGCFIAANGTDLLVASAGTCTITATKAASATYRARTSTIATMTFNKIAQSAALVLSDSAFTFGTTLPLSATGGNGGGTLSYGVSSPGSAGCSVTGNVVSATSGGSCSVIATRAASTNYISHTESFTIMVNKAVQGTLTITDVNGSYGEGLTLAASGGSGTGAVTFTISSVGTSGCSIFSGVVTVTSPGSCTVIANKGSDDSYLARNSATTLLTFSKGTQSELVLADDGMLFGIVLTLSATGGNGDGAISYVLASAGTANCSLSNAEVSATSTGTCTVTATKSSSNNYFSKTQNFIITVAIAPQVSLAVVTTSGTVGESLQLSFTGGSGNGAVSWSVTVVGSARCGLIGSTLLATSAGSCTVRVSKATDDNYLAASATQAIVLTVRSVSNGQQDMPNVASTSSTTSSTTTTTITTIPPFVGKSGGTISSSLAPKTSTTPTTVLGIDKTLQKSLGRIDVSEALMLQGDSSFAAVVTRENNSLVMTAGLFRATIRGLNQNGQLIPLTSNGDLRIPVGGGVSVDMGEYKVGSDVFIWMFSKPTSLGERHVGASGKVISQISTPKNIGEGLHRIVFIGKNPAGGDITFMIGLLVENPSALSTVSKILIVIPIIVAVFLGFLIPTTVRRRRKQFAQ